MQPIGDTRVMFGWGRGCDKTHVYCYDGVTLTDRVSMAKTGCPGRQRAALRVATWVQKLVTGVASNTSLPHIPY